MSNGVAPRRLAAQRPNRADVRDSQKQQAPTFEGSHGLAAVFQVLSPRCEEREVGDGRLSERLSREVREHPGWHIHVNGCRASAPLMFCICWCVEFPKAGKSQQARFFRRADAGRALERTSPSFTCQGLTFEDTLLQEPDDQGRCDLCFQRGLFVHAWNIRVPSRFSTQGRKHGEAGSTGRPRLEQKNCSTVVASTLELLANAASVGATVYTNPNQKVCSVWPSTECGRPMTHGWRRECCLVLPRIGMTA